MKLAISEGSPDDTLPEPDQLPFEPDELGMIYDLWTIWTATDKRYLPSQLIPELLSGHGRILSGLFEMDALYAKTKAELKKRHG